MLSLPTAISDDFIELQAVAQVVLGATLQLGVPVNGAMTASRVITGGQAWAAGR